ncbi:hypothetical protein [Streptomyces sp. URMC 124]|uniref:hypothetical protein n=1 Tax=Streptomyces sp. URMC 124 TaxID=3423405 RepID=UPI003F1E06B4
MSKVPPCRAPAPVSPATVPSQRRVPSAARLLSAPLAELLKETGAQLFESDITDEGFFGAVIVRRGRIVLSMPKGRPARERDVIARGLLGNALGVELSRFPEPLETVSIR